MGNATLNKKFCLICPHLYDFFWRTNWSYQTGEDIWLMADTDVAISNSNSQGPQAHRALGRSLQGSSAGFPVPRKGQNIFLSPSPVMCNIKY